MKSSARNKLIWFQAGNLLVSAAVLAAIPVDVRRTALIYGLFAIKVIMLIYFNDFPAKKDVFSAIFFGLACIEVILLFLFGSFSIYTYVLAQI